MARLTDADFASVFATRVRPLRRTAYLLCGDWARAEDLVQTAFVRTYAGWGRIRDLGAVDAYLRTTLTHVYLDDARRLWSGEVPTEAVPDVPDVVTGSSADATDDRLALMAALQRVPPRQRACLVLRFFDDCSVEETSLVLGCSEGTVKSNTARGLDALRSRLLPDLTIRSNPS